MASSTRVEWAIRYDDGRTQEITLTGDNPADTAWWLRKLAGNAVVTGGVLLRRTITTTEWAVPDADSLD